MGTSGQGGEQRAGRITPESAHGKGCALLTRQQMGTTSDGGNKPNLCE